MVTGFGATDVGRRRQLNEDSLLVDENSRLYIVADGMGGHNAGEVASKLAVEMVANFVRRSLEEEEITWPYGVDPRMSMNENRLRTAIMLANKRVWKEADSRQDYTGMGTTIVAALLDQSIITIASAGDSRAYRIRRGRLKQITTDDSWVQVAINEGVLRPEEAENHPMKNIITKAIGAKEKIDVNIYEQALEAEDLFLLCSDGLHGVVEGQTILEIFEASGGNLEECVHALIAAANDTGGRDNITAVALRYRE